MSIKQEPESEHINQSDNRDADFLANRRFLIAPEYRKMQESVQKATEISNIKEAVDILDLQLDNSNKLYKKPNLDQAPLDALFMQRSSIASGKLVKSLHTDSVIFNNNHFVTCLLSRFTNKRLSLTRGENKSDSVDFTSIGKEYSNLICDAPSFQFMYGCFDPGLVQTHKQRRKTTHSFNYRQIKTVKPEVSDLSENSADTPQEVEAFYSKLKADYRQNKSKPLEFFKCFNDPQSFSKTVENLFYSSFLVKEGLIKIEADGNEKTLVEPIRRRNDGSRSKEKETRQCIVTLTKKDWKKFGRDAI